MIECNPSLPLASFVCASLRVCRYPGQSVFSGDEGRVRLVVCDGEMGRLAIPNLALGSDSVFLNARYDLLISRHWGPFPSSTCWQSVFFQHGFNRIKGPGRFLPAAEKRTGVPAFSLDHSKTF